MRHVQCGSYTNSNLLHANRGIEKDTAAVSRPSSCLSWAALALPLWDLLLLKATSTSHRYPAYQEGLLPQGAMCKQGVVGFVGINSLGKQAFSLI